MEAFVLDFPDSCTDVGPGFALVIFSRQRIRKRSHPWN